MALSYLFLLIKPFLGLFAIWIPKLKQLLIGQKESAVKLKNFQRDPNKKLFWLHSPSLGEFEQGRVVLEAFKNQNPNWQFIVTFFSPSGYNIRKNWPAADAIFYLPFDFGNSSYKFINTLKPNLIVWTKYDFWPGYLYQIQKKQIPCILISGIFRPSQHFFKPWGAPFRKLLTAFDFLLVQNHQSVDLLKPYFGNKVLQAGDTRFDRVIQIAQSAPKIQQLEALKDSIKPTLIIGSAWPQDLDFLLPALKRYKNQLNIIIAPHELHYEWKTKTQNFWGDGFTLWSNLKSGQSFSDGLLWVDAIGLLSSIYQYGTAAYIGGAFTNGLHNIIEATAFALPISFGGPKFHKFKEAIDLLNCGVATSITTQPHLNAHIQNQWLNTEACSQLGAIAKAYTLQNAGATSIALHQAYLALDSKKQSP